MTTYVEFHPQITRSAGGRPKLSGVSSSKLRAPGTDDALEQILETFEYDLHKPTSIEAWRVGSTSCYLVHLGFALRFSTGNLRWLRFEVTLDHHPIPMLRIAALLPKLIETDMEFVGPISVSEAGGLHRETVKVGSSGLRGTKFNANVLGFLPDARTACWDFLPFDSTLGTESDSLVMSVCAPSGEHLVIRARLCFAIQIPGIGMANMQCPSEIGIC